MASGVEPKVTVTYVKMGASWVNAKTGATMGDADKKRIATCNVADDQNAFHAKTNEIFEKNKKALSWTDWVLTSNATLLTQAENEACKSFKN